MDLVVPVLLGVNLHVLDDLADRRGVAIGEILGDHQAAGDVIRVGAKSTQVACFFGSHHVEDRLGVIVVEIAEQIGLLGTGQLLEDRRRHARFQSLHGLDGLHLGHLVHHHRRLPGRQRRQQPRPMVVVQAGDTQGHLEGPQVVEIRAQLLPLGCVDQPLEFAPGLKLRLLHAHRGPPLIRRASAFWL